MTRVVRPATAIMVVPLLLTMVTGCSHIPRPHWPWQHRQARPPEEVHELVITSHDGSVVSFPQYWKSNTLVVNMQSATGEGSVVLKPREHTVWPVRIAFRVMPGQFGELDIQANQHVVLPITAVGAQPVDLELAPGVFIMKSPQMTVSWRAAQSPGS